MPRIYNWTGNLLALGFDQLRSDRLHFQPEYLIDLFKTLVHNSKTPVFATENIRSVQDGQEQSLALVKRHELPFSVKKREIFTSCKTNNFHVKNLQEAKRGQDFMKRFNRMKTIYGHANLGEQPMSISCIEFDLSNKYIITAADDKLVKVWLATNGSLQGVLYGHTDVIIDLQISYCNRYIISAGKEGKILIWDLLNLKLLHVCDEHSGPVNSLKVVQTKLLKTEAQLLYSGSEDGFINVYNLDNIGLSIEELEEDNPVKTRRAKPSQNKNPVFLFSLDSTYFTGNKNNKKINSIDVSNKRGLIFSGCYGGDLLIWRTDNYRRDKVVKEAYELVSKFKAHSQILHLISISPDENFFMTGATDGTVKIWRQPETSSEISNLIDELERGVKDGGNKKEY